jgi:hypothetical protein
MDEVAHPMTTAAAGTLRQGREQAGKAGSMDVSGVGRSGYAPLPTVQDMAAVLAARSAMAQLSAQALVQASAQADGAVPATGSASVGGQVDMYL